MVPPSFPATERALAAEVEDGLLTRGAQVAVFLAGEPVLRTALGDAGMGQSMTDDTLFRVYCSIKPVTALAVAQLVAGGQLDLDQPLGSLLPGYASLADGTVHLRHVLNHTAGLHLPMALELELTPPEKRRSMLERVERPPGWRVGLDAAYSEHFGWHVLGRLLEETTGEPLREHLRAAVLEPLDMADTWIGMTDAEYDANVERIGVNYDLRTLSAYPLLLERGRRMCTEINPAHGGYTTATDLARLYNAVLARADDPVVSQFTSPARERVYDRVLGRECGYGLGFMTGLVDHQFGRAPSRSAYGHSGNVGSSFAYADPEHDLAVAVLFNGVVDAESAFLRRPVVVRAVYEDLTAFDVGEPEAPSGGRLGRLLRRR